MVKCDYWDRSYHLSFAFSIFDVLQKRVPVTPPSINCTNNGENTAEIENRNHKMGELLFSWKETVWFFQFMLVSLAAVFSVVHDDTKHGCEGDYSVISYHKSIHQLILQR